MVLLKYIKNANAKIMLPFNSLTVEDLNPYNPSKNGGSDLIKALIKYTETKIQETINIIFNKFLNFDSFLSKGLITYVFKNLDANIARKKLIFPIIIINVIFTT